jgi:hypothetical protein
MNRVRDYGVAREPGKSEFFKLCMTRFSDDDGSTTNNVMASTAIQRRYFLFEISVSIPGQYLRGVNGVTSCFGISAQRSAAARYYSNDSTAGMMQV